MELGWGMKEGWHTMVGVVKHTHDAPQREPGPSGRISQTTLAFPIWVRNQARFAFASHRSRPSVREARHPSTCNKPPSTEKVLRSRRGEAEGERRYCQQLLLLRVQYIQVQSIKLLQTVTPKQTEESFSSDT